MADNPSEETYSEEEARKRAEATLKVMLATPHKPHREAKIGKLKSKRV